MGMKADGNLYIAAQFLDTFDEIGKQVEKGAAKISNNTKIDLSLDEKNILKEINNLVGSVKFKDLDLSDIISSVFASISKEGISSKDRAKVLDNFQTSLRIFHSAPLKNIKQLKGVKSEDLTGIIQEIQTDFFSESSKRKWTSTTLKNNVKEIIAEHLRDSVDSTIGGIQEALVQEFGKDTAKYGVSGKEANNRLNNIYDSLVEKAKEQSKIEGNNVGLDEIVTDNELKSIQGFYSRIESLGGIASDKAKKLADMLTSMSNDGAIEEGLDDIFYQISEDVNSFTEREKQLIQETKQQQKEIDELNAQNKSSSRQKIKPNFNVENQEQDTTSTIFQSAEKENKIQETKTQQQENKKIIEQANEITATESKTVDIKKQQTQEIEKQNDLLKKQKQIKDETTPIKSEIDISSQDQVQQEIQETASTAQSAVKSNEQLAESVQEVTQAVQQEGQAFDNLSQENINQNKKNTISNIQKEVEVKKEVAQFNKENVKLEQQTTTEIEKQTKQEQQKAKTGIIRKTRKLPDVKKIGKSQTEIKEQIKQEEEEKINKNKKETAEFKKNLKESEKSIRSRKNNKREEVDVSTINIGNSSELFKEFISAGEAEENVGNQAQKATKSVETLNNSLKETAQAQKQLNEEILKGNENKNQSKELANIDKKLNDVKTDIPLSKSTEKDKTKEIEQTKEEVIQTSKEELKTEQQITNELKQQKEVKQSINVGQQVNKTEPELQNTKKIKEETQQIIEQQKKVTEAKQETLQTAREELKTEQQLYTETQKQESAEEQKAKILIVNKGKKLPNVQRHGKTQAEIDAQLKAEKEKKKKKSFTLKSDLDEKKRAEAAAAADAEEDKEKQRQQEIEDQNFLAALRAKYAEAEAEQAKKEAQKIQVSSDKMQRLKQEIQEATESLKDYKEIDEQIVKLQSKKDAYIISPSTQNEMMQAGVLSSSIDMAEYIRSAYRTYKKTGNEADEKVLKEALRQYMLPVGKKNGEYTYRDDKYLYSKNGKELKSYTKDKDFKGYIKQAQDEEAAYEKAQRKLPTLLDQKKSGQQSFVETSAKIQQLLQESGLDADKVNEILAAINGNLTNEEAIWKVINSYIKEATEELEKQDNIAEKKESLISENANKEAISNENIEQTNIVEQQEKNQQAVEKTIELTEKAQEQIQELTDSKIPESTVVSEIGKEAESTKEKLEKVVDSVEEVKNKSTSKPVNKGATKENSEFSYKEFARGHISETNSPFIDAKKWMESGVKTDNIKQLETYYEKYNNIKNRLKATKDKPENKANFKLLIDEYDSVRKSVMSVLDVIGKLNSEENKMLASQKAHADIVKGTINNRATLARSAQKRLDSDYYDKQVSKTENVLSQYTSAESPEAAKAIEQANNALEKYKNTIIELKQFNSGELQLDRPFEELIEEVNKADVEVKELTKNIQDNFSKVANSNSITDLQSQIKSILSTYNRISPEGKQKLEDIFGSLKIGETTTKQLANFRTQLRATIAEERELGNLSSTIFDRMVGKMQEGIAFLATKVSFYEIFNQFRNGFEIIHQFDDALTEMMKVSDETRTSLERYQKTTFETADAIGTSALQIQNSTADFMRLGETLDQAAESAKSANVLMNVSEFQSIDEATKSLIAMGAAYNDLSKMNIIDKLNEVGLKIA